MGQTKGHVDTFDQIESEKHEYKTKSKVAELDPLSKFILVYQSVNQFFDLATDALLLYDMYRYSRINYVPCSDTRIDFIHDDPYNDDGTPNCHIITQSEFDEMDPS
jgi:hypothetical protein